MACTFVLALPAELVITNNASRYHREKAIADGDKTEVTTPGASGDSRRRVDERKGSRTKEYQLESNYPAAVVD